MLIGATLATLVCVLILTAPAPNIGSFAPFRVFAQQTQPIGPYGFIPWVANTAGDTATIKAYQLTGLLVGTPTAAATYTTDTATNLCSLFPFVGSQNASNWGWDLYLKNTSGGAFTITMAAGAGVTLVGTGTAAQNNLRHFKVVLTCCPPNATAAASLYSLETSAF
jgi:hypothetical protein